MTMNPSAKEAIFKHGLMCRCPRCGKGRLFDGFLKLAPRCEACGLDYSFADPADGPAFFIMIIMGIPAAGFGVWVEIMWQPSVCVHLLTSGPFLLLTCIPPIRIAKGMLVASQYFHKAEEGRFEIPKSRNGIPGISGLGQSATSDGLNEGPLAAPLQKFSSLPERTRT